MTQRPAPRPGSPTTDLRRVSTYVPLEQWGEVMDRAAKAGMSVSAYVRALIERDTLDENGRPVWVQPAAVTEELPLAQTA